MNSTLRIELDGTLITGRVDGIENFVVTKRSEDEEGKIATSFSSELTFYDDGYAIIKTKLIDSPFGFSDYVNVKIYDDYCGIAVFEGRIQGDGLDWCEPNCYVSANIIEQQAEVTCIQNTVITDNRNGFLNKTYNGVKYCIQIRPFFLHVLLGFIFTLLMAVAIFIGFSLMPVIFIIWGFCLLFQVICGIFGCDKPECTKSLNNPWEFWDVYIQGAIKLFDTCNFKHPTAYVRDYINNVCNICGLTFKSTILNDQSSLYYNLGLFSAQVKKGKRVGPDDDKLIEDNLPVETVVTLMNTYLKPLFNAEYRIANGELIFERKDYFFNSTNIWIDSETLMQKGLIEDNAICYSWIDKERYAYADYQYTMDASEYIGNEVRRRWQDVVEWNPAPVNLAQKGGLSLTIPSSCARTLTDGISFDATIEDNDVLHLIVPNYVNDRTMVMSQHRAFNYKFILLDGAFIQNDFSDSFCGGQIPDVPNPRERVNYPMWFREGYDNNLYSLFHYINNPRLPGSTNYNFKFTLSFDCATYQSFSFDKTVSLVMGGQVKYGQVKELTIDFNKRTITVNGIV